MPQPYNYDLGIPTTFQSLSQLAAADAQLEATKIARQNAEINKIKSEQLAKTQLQALETQKKRDEYIATFLANKNPKVEDFNALSIMLAPSGKQYEAVNSAWLNMSKDRQENETKFSTQVLASAISDKPDVTLNLLNQKAQAAKNAGDTARYDTMKNYANFVENNLDKPTIVKKVIGLLLAGAPNGKDIIKSAFDAISLPSNVETSENTAATTKAESEIKNIELQNLPEKNMLENKATRAKTEALINSGLLEKDKFLTETQLKIKEMNDKTKLVGPDAIKLVNDFTIDAVKDDQLGDSMLDLSNRIRTASGGKGIFTSASEWFAKAIGTQDAYTQLRKEYVRIRNTNVINGLPKGSASDRDISIIMAGFPEENSDGEYIANFLGAFGRVSKLAGILKTAQADWVGSNGSMGRARKDLEINGIPVAAGNSFPEFMKIYWPIKQAEMKATTGANQAIESQKNKPGQGYLRFAGGR